MRFITDFEMYKKSGNVNKSTNALRMSSFEFNLIYKIINLGDESPPLSYSEKKNKFKSEQNGKVTSETYLQQIVSFDIPFYALTYHSIYSYVNTVK